MTSGTPKVAHRTGAAFHAAAPPARVSVAHQCDLPGAAEFVAERRAVEFQEGAESEDEDCDGKVWPRQVRQIGNAKSDGHARNDDSGTIASGPWRTFLM
jgi:hypothetical protein